MATDLSLESRRRDNRRHPMMQQDGYWLETDVAAEYFDTLCEWIELLKSGLCWTGDSQVGKSTCIKNIARRIRDEYPDVAVTLISGERSCNRPNQDRFLKNCLEQTRRTSVGRGESLCARMTNHLINECGAVRGRIMVLFLDEGQAFLPEEYDALRSVWNRMNMQGYALLVYTVGNDELLANASREDVSGRHGNVGRFFVKFSNFNGITSEGSLSRILEQFDTGLTYPNAQWPYTRYFAQAAFDKQWRLADESTGLHRALLRMKGATAPSSDFTGWCMGPLLKSVHAMLKDALLTEGYDPSRTPVDWHEILERHAEAHLLCRRI